MNVRVRERRSDMRTGRRGCVHAHRSALVLALPLALTLVSGCDGNAADSRPAPAATKATATANGNGIDRLSGTEILNRAGKASSTVKSVRIRGEFTEDGQHMTLDISASDKESASGDITMDGKRIQVIRIGSTAYIKGDAAFWKSVGGQSAVGMFSGKYLKVPTTDKDFRDLTSLTFTSKIFSELLKPEGPVTKDGQARINGIAAIALGDGTGDHLYVATEGEPYVLRVQSGKEAIDFSYNEPVTVTPPPRDSVISV